MYLVEMRIILQSGNRELVLASVQGCNLLCNLVFFCTRVQSGRLSDGQVVSQSEVSQSVR